MSNNQSGGRGIQALVAKFGDQAGLEVAEAMAALQETVMPNGGRGVSNGQLAAFLSVAGQYELNPFLKQIYAFPGKGSGVVPMVGIDGWVSLANRNPNCDGWEFDYIWKDDKPGGDLLGITCRIYHKQRQHPVTVTEWMAECSRKTDPWKDMPNRMLRHKTFAQAVRMAFGVSGIYDEDEASDQGPRDAEATVVGTRTHGSAPSSAGKSPLEQAKSKVQESEGDRQEGKAEDGQAASKRGSGAAQEDGTNWLDRLGARKGDARPQGSDEAPGADEAEEAEVVPAGEGDADPFAGAQA